MVTTNPTLAGDRTETTESRPPARALLEVTPELAERLRDPRLVLAGLAFAAGAVALLLGWWGVSGTLDPGVQLSYFISGGLGAMFLAGLGAVLVSSSNMRLATKKIDDLQRSVDGLATSLADLRAELDSRPVTRNGRPLRRKSPVGS